MSSDNDRAEKGPMRSPDYFWLDDSETGTPEVGAAGLTMSDLMKHFDVSSRSLRLYERRGLLKPRRYDQARVYSRADCRCIAAVVKARKLGFTLAEIKEIMEAAEDDAHPLTLHQKRAVCVRQTTVLARQRAQIEDALDELHRIYDRLSAQTAISE
jgi:DNA-binding transcriptional MerR regulator